MVQDLALPTAQVSGIPGNRGPQAVGVLVFLEWKEPARCCRTPRLALMKNRDAVANSRDSLHETTDGSDAVPSSAAQNELVRCLWPFES